MASGQGGKGLFFGWWVVGASTLCISTGPGPFVFAAAGLFMLPLSAEFGWGRDEISFALTVMLTATAISLPFIGRYVDKVGSRRILLPSMLMLALGLISVPLLVSEWWHFVLAYLFLGTLAAGTNSVPYMPILSAWFFKYRGLAIGISIAGIGLGYFYVPLLLQYLIDNVSWRSGYYALAAIVVGLALPLAFFFLRESPASMGLMPDGAVSGEAPKATSKKVGYTVPEIVRMREFWMLSAIFVILSFVLNGMLAHLVPMLTDRGMDTATAAKVAALEGGVIFLSRILIGYLIDHFFAPRVAMCFFSLSAIGIALFAFGAVDGMAFFAIVLIGLSLGAEVDLLAYLAARYFGLRSFGSTYGLLFAAILTGTALGPLLFGIGFEQTGSYVNILTICVGINIGAVILTGLLGRYPDWEQIAADQEL